MGVIFDATGDQYTRTTGLPSVTSVAFMCWFRIESAADTYKCLFQLAATTPNTNGYFMLVVEAPSAGGHLEAVVFDGTNSHIEKLFVPTINTWYFAALQAGNPGTVDSFVSYRALGDTVMTTSPSWTSLSFTPATMYIGNDFDTEFFGGTMAAVKIFDTGGFSDSELFRESMIIRPYLHAGLPSLVHAEYSFLSATNAHVDISGNGKTLTVGGTMTDSSMPPIGWMGARRRRVLTQRSFNRSGFAITNETRISGTWANVMTPTGADF